MTYITYSKICANLVRNCLKEPFKAEAMCRKRLHFSLSKWIDDKPKKPSFFFFLLIRSMNYLLQLILLSWFSVA
ncbi:hypothetical protein Ahy_A01g003442 isoform B [Arachis hypogaea]|nr:hypothetical protein Ahy_A01g003442 isoform B [Arachis hypogaea]